MTDLAVDRLSSCDSTGQGSDAEPPADCSSPRPVLTCLALAYVAGEGLVTVRDIFMSSSSSGGVYCWDQMSTGQLVIHGLACCSRAPCHALQHCSIPWLHHHQPPRTSVRQATSPTSTASRTAAERDYTMISLGEYRLAYGRADYLRQDNQSVSLGDTHSRSGARSLFVLEV